VTWLVRRRLRIPLAVALGLVALAGVVAVVGRSAWVAAAEARGLLPCLEGVETGVCATGAWSGFSADVTVFHRWFTMALMVLPGVAGAVVGAALFGGELAQGTHVFALSQSVSRMRWFGTGLLVAGLPVAAAIALLTPLAAWRTAPFADVVQRSVLDVDVFLVSGAVPAAYAVLAFSVAAAAGLLLRSTAGALGLALAVQVAVLLITSIALRPYYLPPERAVTPITTASVDSYALHGSDLLRVDGGYVDARGRTVPYAEVNSLPCPGEQQEYADCLIAAGLGGLYTDYHPPSRYWPFQAIESGLLLALAAAALGAGLWGLRRRVH
jgi:hypothetical protein